MNRAIILMVVIVAFLLLLTGCSGSVSDIPLGEYEFEFPFLYTYPSSVARVDYVEEGTDVVIEKNGLTITQNATGKTLEISKPIYKMEKLDVKMTEALRKETFSLMGLSDLSKYKNKYCYTVYESKDVPAHMFPYIPDDLPANISLYVMDDELWLAPYWGDKISREGEPYRKHDFIARLKPKTD